MFAESIVETSWAQRSRRNWTTLTSFGLQAVVISVLLIFPILRNVGLPAARTVSTPVTLGRMGELSPQTRAQVGRTSAPIRNFDPNRLLLPSHHPVVSEGSEQAEMPAPDGFGGDGIGLPLGAPNGLPISVFSGAHPVMPAAPPKPATRAFRPSNLLEGSLMRRVQPVYPPLARSARIQGSVVLFALISKAGTIQNLRAISGHPMLIPAAVDAVSQWRYRPYILNGEPIEVETQITVNFVLGN